VAHQNNLGHGSPHLWIEWQGTYRLHLNYHLNAKKTRGHDLRPLFSLEKY
jgi:hypothetical protein